MNPWCERVFNAMARDCVVGEENCQRKFRIVADGWRGDGWPMRGECECGRRWEVHERKIRQLKPGEV